MIVLLTGNKTEQKAYIKNLCEQQGILSERIQHFYSDDFEEKSFENIVPVNTGLFGERECFVLHNVTRDIPLKTILKDYASSEHILIFSEESILKKDRTAFEKIGANIKEFAKEEKKEEKKVNTFALADFLGEKNKKNLWLAFREAIESGESPESIHGILFWQMKNLALVKAGDTKEMSPYVARKNEVFARNWTTEEIQNFASQLTKIYHTRDTYSTLEIEIEKMILLL
jgi:DNA polymerase III delta subunit